MTSQINTNGINVNYPVPGQNNSSQGFRDNFAQIKTQIDAGATEITDLQSKVVLKAALNDSTLNNDMANTQISNLSTRGFRATTYNLGNALAGTVLVDVNRADVHYGALTGNVTLQFGNWAPTNTESNVVVRFTVANANAVISFPSSVVSSNSDYGVTLLENYAIIANVATVTAPANATILEYRFSTIDCGNTITVEPTNRPYQATQIKDGSPSPIGFPGDTPGTVLTDSSYFYLCTANFAGTVNSTKTIANTFASGNIITLSSTTGMTVADPIIFTGNVYGGLVANSVYYIKTISSPNITVSSTGFDGVVGNAFALTTANGAGANAISYTGTAIWKRIDLAGTTGNDVVTGNLQVNYAANIGTTLTVGGNIFANTGNVVATNMYSNTGNIGAANIIASNIYANTGNANVGNLTVNGLLTASNISINQLTNGNSNVVVAANGNITMGVAGNANVMTVTGTGVRIGGNANLTGNLTLATSNLIMTGGLNGYFLQTDGAGNLTWATGTVLPPVTGAGGSNTQIQFNDASAPNGAAGFTYNKVTQLTSLPNGLAVVGNANIGNVGTATAIITTGNITTVNGNIANATTIIANATNGMVFANNLTASGNASGAVRVDSGIQAGVGLGLGFRSAPSITYTDNQVGASSTNPVGAIHALSIPNIAAVSGSVTFTNAATFYIAGAPVASTNVTIPNPYALYVAAGNSLLAGNVIFTGNVIGTIAAGANNITTTGNITGGNIIGTYANGNSNVRIATANGNVTIAAVGNTVMTITGTGANITGTANITGNANVGNLGFGTGNITGTGNVIAGNHVGNVGFGAGTVIGTGNVTAGNIIGTIAAGSNNITTTGNLSAGNIIGTTIINTTSNITTTGNITITGTTGRIGIGTATPDADLNILASPQTVSYPLTGNSDTAGTDIHISGADASITRITQDVFGTGSYNAFTGRTGRGTAASPSQSISGDILTQFTARGFSGGTQQFGTQSTARIDMIAAENFTDTSRATNVVIYTTSAGNIAPTAIANFASNTGLTVNGNITGANLLGPHANGNSNVNIPAANGNVNISAVGNANVLVVTGTGVNVNNATFNTGTGNANLGNLGTATAIITTGNITTINSTTGNITTVNGNVANATTIIANATNGMVFANNHTASGNASGAVRVDSGIQAGVGLGLGFRSAFATYTDNQVGASSTNPVGAIHALSIPNIAAVSGAVTFTNAATFYVAGAPVANTNVTIPNPYSIYVASGNSYLAGNVTFAGNIIGIHANGNSNVNIPTANGNVVISAVGNTTMTITGTGANITGTLNATGNANLGNLGTATANITTGNITTIIGTTGNIATVNGNVANASTIIANATGGTVFANNITTSGNSSGSVRVDAGISTSVGLGLGFRSAFATYTDNQLGAGTYSVGAIHALSAPNIAAANPVTFNNAATFYIAGAPVANTNVTIPAPFALYVAAGNSYLSGNVTFAGNILGILANGNSNVNIPAANGNVNFSASGNANILVVTGTGANINGTANVTGNISVGNLIGTIAAGSNNITTTGNVSAGNLIGSYSNGNSNVGIPAANGNVNFSATGNANILVITGTGAYASRDLIVTGTGGLGYGTGSGGTVTQITSRATPVTLNKTNGSITLFTAIGSVTATTFTVNNTTVAATDVIQVSVRSSTNTYLAFVSAVAASSFNITFYTTGGTVSDTPVFNFAVIKAVVA